MRSGETISNTDIKAYRKTVRRAKDGLTSRWKPVADSLEAEFDRITNHNKQVADEGAARTAKKAARAKAVAQRNARFEVAKAFRAIEKKMARTGKVSEEELTKVSAAIKALNPTNETKGWERTISELRRLKALRAAGAGLGAALTSSLGGKLALAGSKKGDALKVSMKYAADRCYAVFMTVDSVGRKLPVTNIEWRRKKGALLQEFGVPNHNRRWNSPRPEGFCSTEKGKATLTADLALPGSSTLQYAVLEWKRSEFPAYLGQRVFVVAGDYCDEKYWKQLWLNPVPGSILYIKNEPFIVSTDGQLVLTINGEWLKSSATLTDSPQGSVAFNTIFETKKCEQNGRVLGRRTAAIRRCHEKITKSQESAWDSVGRLREAARRQGGISPSAEKKASRLKEKSRSLRKKRCDPLEEKAQEARRKAFDAIVEEMTANPTTNKLSRSEHLKTLRE